MDWYSGIELQLVLSGFLFWFQWLLCLLSNYYFFIMLQVADLFLEATKKKVNSLVSRTPRITYTVTVIETFFYHKLMYTIFRKLGVMITTYWLIACCEYDVKCYWFQTSGRWSVRYLKSTGLTLPRQRLHMIVRHAQLVTSWLVHSNV